MNSPDGKCWICRRPALDGFLTCGMFDCIPVAVKERDRLRTELSGANARAERLARERDEAEAQVCGLRTTGGCQNADEAEGMRRDALRDLQTVRTAMRMGDGMTEPAATAEEMARAVADLESERAEWQDYAFACGYEFCSNHLAGQDGRCVDECPNCNGNGWYNRTERESASLRSTLAAVREVLEDAWRRPLELLAPPAAEVLRDVIARALALTEVGDD